MVVFCEHANLENIPEIAENVLDLRVHADGNLTATTLAEIFVEESLSVIEKYDSIASPENTGRSTRLSEHSPSEASERSRITDLCSHRKHSTSWMDVSVPLATSTSFYDPIDQESIWLEGLKITQTKIISFRSGNIHGGGGVNSFWKLHSTS